MYRIYADGAILHNPMFSEEGRVVINPVLHEKLNTHGSLDFDIAPTNPLYNALKPRDTKIKVVSDSENNKPWFGRVISMEQGWKNIVKVHCEGELGYLCDSIVRPYVFNGSPEDLLDDLIDNYNGSSTRGYTFVLGNVSVVDPNNYIVRSSVDAASVWDVIDDALFGSSLGGYIVPRYDAENDVHYVDYLSLDENDQYAVTSSQVIEFGRNLLDFLQTKDASPVITALIPYGAQRDESDPETKPTSSGHLETWDGNRITIASVNDGKRWIDNEDGKAIFGRVVGSHVWDDVTVPANLLTKAQAYLAQQIFLNANLEITAVDLAFVDVDIEQIQVAEYVQCKSKPHDMNVLMLCTEKTTYLTQLERSAIILGAGLKTITDLQKGAK